MKLKIFIHKLLAVKRKHCKENNHAQSCLLMMVNCLMYGRSPHSANKQGERWEF